MIAYALNDTLPAHAPVPRALPDRTGAERDANVVPFNRPGAREAGAAPEPDDMEILLEQLHAAAIVLSPQFVILRTRGSAPEWLQRHFPRGVHPLRLPETLERWVRAQLQRPATSVPCCRFETDDHQLWIKLSTVRSSAGHLLLLRERPRPDAPKRLEQLGLSPREAEVLSWLVQGKSNPEIGRILGIASRTVHKHLEHIYAHLGVENRTAATALILDPL